MSKRYMPNLDGIDAGERPVLGIRETFDLADMEINLPDAFVYDPHAEAQPGSVDDLFDAYE